MAEELSAEALKAVIAGCADGFVLTREGRYIFTNEAWAELLVRAPEQLTERSVFDDVHPDFQDRLARWLERPDVRTATEFSFMRSDGSIAIFHLSAIRGPEGSTGFIARDLTEVKRIQAKQLLADRMMSVGALAAGVAHEINNPLSYVLGNLTYLSEECDTAEVGLPDVRRQEIQEALSEALEGAERVKGIVGGLQAFARADRETLKAVDVNGTIETAINMSWIEIRHRARLVKSLGELPPVRANESTLGQVFLNLLLNASHALPVGKAKENEITVESHVDGEQVVVRIRDTGPGIPQDVVDHVFDAFFTKAPPGIGSGLALSISHSVVTDLGGTIGVRSSSAGSTFEVRLPAYRPEEERDPPEEARRRTREGGRRRILVIDDEVLLVNSITRALRAHEVLSATSGREAVALLERDADFDLILCDLMMPEMSGMDVYAWVRNHRPGLERDIVFLTGHIFDEGPIAFLRNVRNSRIQKPFELDALRRFVSDFRSIEP